MYSQPKQSRFHTSAKPREEVAPQVWIGALPTPEIARDAIAAGVTALLDLTAPTDDQLADAVRFIESESARGIVFIHCKAGYSRTAGVVGAWMLETGRAQSIGEVVAQLEAIRPGIVIRSEIRDALRRKFPKHDV